MGLPPRGPVKVFGFFAKSLQDLRGRWRYLPWVAVALVLVTRVYVGAHNPLDVICGAALGFAIGGALNLIVGVPASSHETVDTLV